MIVLIDNFDSFTYNLYQLLVAHDQVVVLRNDVATIGAIEQLSPTHLVISPGPGRPSDAGHCIDVIRHYAEQQLPILGVCLGHQAIVEAFGGEVVLTDTPVHGKPTRVFHHQEGLYREMPHPFQAARYHSLVAKRESLPECLIVESSNAEGMIMGVRHHRLPIHGVQFHPESIMTPQGSLLIRNFLCS